MGVKMERERERERREEGALLLASRAVAAAGPLPIAFFALS